MAVLQNGWKLITSVVLIHHKLHITKQTNTYQFITQNASENQYGKFEKSSNPDTISSHFIANFQALQIVFAKNY